MVNSSRVIPPNSTFTFIAIDQAGIRLDKYVSLQFPYYSRSFLQGLIEKGCVSINGQAITKTSATVKNNDSIQVTFPPVEPLEPFLYHNCPIDVELLYEHEHFLILNKPANLVVHKPHTSSTECTLVDWILKSYKEIATIGAADRPGIVHRLDKDTSGVIIIPRTPYALATFGQMFSSRTISKTYLAIVQGHPPKSGTVDWPIGRCLRNKTKMTTYNPAIYSTAKSRQALTNYTVLEYFQDTALVEVKPVTGRTHQIRVHLNSIGHPIIGDIVYGTSSLLIKRQALHAYQISFTFDGTPHLLTAPLSEDLQAMLKKLRNQPA
ncbi:MAG: RluA family pseudouridine synthase [Candidatus Babeliales bacterium]|nr:RluA family pseudouridine synthase [Candidatus Babeliales bacterium]